MTADCLGRRRTAPARPTLRGLFLALGLLCGLVASACRPGAVAEHAANTAERGAGSLVICGGGDLPAAIYTEFLALGGGDAARLVVIPTAGRERDKLDPERIRARWRARGDVAAIRVVHTRSRREADRAAFVAPLADATAVWMSGGAQSRLADTYVGTAVERELYALLARGGVVGGTSAGAAVQSRVMIARGNPDVELGVGFDLLPGSVVDQHFVTRDRRPRLRRVLASHPDLVGFGIDEGTALVVTGETLRVLGESSVTVMLAGRADAPSREIVLEPGDRADLSDLRAAAQRAAAFSFLAAPPARAPRWAGEGDRA